MREALWQGPLADPDSPQREVLAWMPDYPVALDRLRELVRHALPADEALAEALRRWPWSVDLGWLIAENGGGTAALEAVVRDQRRRHGTLAWALWFDGQPEAALACLQTLDPDSPSHAADLFARVELSILADRPADVPPGTGSLRLSWLRDWRQRGGAGLARRLDSEGAPPDLAGWLFDALLTERDYDRARAIAQSPGLAIGERALLAAQLALEAGDPADAQAHLGTLEDLAPWDWPARRHVLDLRAGLLQGAMDRADAGPLLARIDAALRLFPRHGGLRGLRLDCRLRVHDWDRVIADLAADPRDAAALTRLGRPDMALECLDRAPPAPLDDLFRRALQRAEALLRLGRPDDALAALPPVPAARPLAADLAWWRAEIALARRDLPTARAALGPALEHSPTRMGLHLSAARLAFFEGDAPRAQDHLSRFSRLKTAQLRVPPPDDLRDRIVADAVAQGPRAAAARRFARATPVFSRAQTTVPRHIAHYWEGPRSAPVERGLAAWGRLLPQTLYDAPAARDWLRRHAPALTPLFDRLRLPAARADLFRVALVARQGGVFADLDEYPRHGIDDWLEGTRAVLVIEEGHGTLANNFLAAIPGLPLFARLQDRIAAALAATDTPYPWWDTGPAQLTVEAASEPTDGLRFLTQADYDARISTNLPFPHKSGPAHWR